MAPVMRAWDIRYLAISTLAVRIAVTDGGASLCRVCCGFWMNLIAGHFGIAVSRDDCNSDQRALSDDDEGVVAECRCEAGAPGWPLKYRALICTHNSQRQAPPCSVNTSE